MNYRIVFPFFPAATFLLLDQAGYPDRIVISGTFFATAVIFYATRRYRLISAATLFGFAVAAVSTAVGIIIKSEHAFLASGPISDYLTGLIVGGSLILGRPLVGGFAREVFPALGSRLPVDAPVFVGLSFLWVGFDFVRGTLRFFLLAQMSPSEYVIWSRVAHWPLTGLVLLVTVVCVARAAGSYGSRLPEPASEPHAVT